MASVTGERIFRLTADGALRQALEKLPEAGRGLYSGGLGIHYVAREMGRDIDEDAVIRQAAPARSALDVIAGSAGAIAALLYLRRGTRTTRLLEAAVQHGDLLLAEASKEETGWSWKATGVARNLTGFAHGAAGIGWALTELYAATQEGRFRTAALEAFRYERSCWNPAERNWPDSAMGKWGTPIYLSMLPRSSAMKLGSPRPRPPQKKASNDSSAAACPGPAVYQEQTKPPT